MSHYGITSSVLMISCILGCSKPVKTSRDQWWFPVGSTGSNQVRYRAIETVTQSREPHQGEKKSTREECDFTIMLEQHPSEDSVVVRLSDLGESCNSASSFGFWIHYAQMLPAIHQSAVSVTPTEIRFAGGPILRGPWREGDRLTYAWWLMVSTGIVHAEVRHADAKSTTLHLEIWGGPALSHWNGAAEITLVNDDDALHAVRGTWSWTLGAEHLDASLVIERTK